MTDKTPDALIDDDWEEVTFKVKKDPNWPHHGTDIEFNGVRYKREDLAAPHAEAVRVLVEALEGIGASHHGKDRAYSQRMMATAALSHPAVVAALSSAEGV